MPWSWGVRPVLSDVRAAAVVDGKTVVMGRVWPFVVIAFTKPSADWFTHSLYPNPSRTMRMTRSGESTSTAPKASLGILGLSDFTSKRERTVGVTFERQYESYSGRTDSSGRTCNFFPSLAPPLRSQIHYS